jgi:hypothetical protein
MWVGAVLALVGAALALLARAVDRRAPVADVVAVARSSSGRLQPADAA